MRLIAPRVAISILIALFSVQSNADTNGLPAGWTRDPGSNCAVSSQEADRKSWEALGKALLGKSDSVAGCVSTPYLAPNYDPGNQCKICNDVHAGADFRAAEGIPVRAPATGFAVFVDLSFDPAQPELGRSTLMIETADGDFRFLLLHMSKIAVKAGDIVLKGEEVGSSGRIGTTAPHLHVEVWPRSSPHFNVRARAITGRTACGSICSRVQIEQYTDDPVALLRYASQSHTAAISRLRERGLSETAAYVVHKAEIAAEIAKRKTGDAEVFLKELKAEIEFKTKEAAARAEKGAAGHAVLNNYRMPSSYVEEGYERAVYKGEVASLSGKTVPHGWGKWASDVSEYSGQAVKGEFSGKGEFNARRYGYVGIFKSNSPFEQAGTYDKLNQQTLVSYKYAESQGVSFQKEQSGHQEFDPSFMTRGQDPKMWYSLNDLGKVELWSGGTFVGKFKDAWTSLTRIEGAYFDASGKVLQHGTFNDEQKD